MRALYAVAAVMAIVGLWFRVAPSPLPATPAASVAVPPVVHQHESTGDAPVATYAPIVTANIFSRARTAPARPGDVAHPDAKPRSAASPSPALTLLGTTIGPQGAVALIDATTSSPPGPQVHRMGDLIAGARLVAITDSTVTLDRPSGPLVLHLQSSPHKKL